MEHVLFIQKVKPDARDEYIRAHRECWPELLRIIRDSGVRREIIWIDGNTLYIYVMAKDFERAIEKQTKTRAFQNWLEKMRPLLEMIQDYSGTGKVKRLEKIFDLEEQLKGIEGSAG